MIYLITWVLAVIISFILCYPLVSYILSGLFPRPKQVNEPKNHKLACVITAYKNMALTRYCIKSLLQQEYKNYHIFLVADDPQDEVPLEDNVKLTVLRPEKPLGSKVRSMFFALEAVKDNFDYVVIFDPDNLAHKNYLKNIDGWLSQGFKAVQGKRTAKNMDTTYACLDAAGEYFYNYFHRTIPFRLGSSALIAGSGMAVETSLFRGFFDFTPIKENFNGVIPGEDKTLQYYISKNNSRIAYAADAIVYDEKISEGYQIKRQRSRWLNSYFGNLKFNLSELFAGILKFNRNRFIFGLSASYPPLFMVLISGFVCGLVVTPFNIYAGITIFSSLLLFVAGFLLFIRLNGGKGKLFKSLLFAPLFIFNQLLALINIGKASKDFMATENKKNISVEELNDAGDENRH